MRRMLTVWSVAALVAAMVLASAMPAMAADNPGQPDNPDRAIRQTQGLDDVERAKRDAMASQYEQFQKQSELLMEQIQKRQPPPRPGSP